MKLADLIKNGLKISKTVLFRFLLVKAGSFLSNPYKLISTIEEAAQKLIDAENNGQLKNEVLKPLKDLYRLIVASVNGNYQNFSRKNLTLSIATLLYFVMPIDLIPDMLPVIGFLDDISLLFWLLNIIQVEINKFLEWEELNFLFNDLEDLDDLFNWESEAPSDPTPPGESQGTKGKDV
ncbi:MAG: YkvA family protein [Chitinophagales bacterium]